MNYGTLVPSFYFYKFAESISQPYTSFMAYRAGAIDEKGNLLKPESSIDPFEYFVIKLKKIFDQLPPGLTRYQLANYSSALNVFAEECEKFNIQKDHFVALVEGWLAANISPDLSYIELLEDMSSANMGGPASSPAYNTGQVSGYDAPMAPMQKRRRPVADEMFHMFDVSDGDFSKIANNQMNEIDYLRRFGIRNPESTVMVRNKKDGNLYTIPKKKKLKEQFNLGFLFEEEAATKAYADSDSDPTENQATLPNSKEKAKRDRKGFVRPKPSPTATHADRFREDVNELIRLHGEATNQKREAQAHEYAARIAFHAHNYHALKDTPHLADYMDKTHQQIISSASANDRGLKSGDVLRAKRTDLGVEYETMDFKSKGANVAAGFPVAFLKDMLARNPEDLASWTRTTSGSRQSFVFPKIKVGGVENPEHAKSARERFESMRSAIEGIQDPNLMQQREAIKKKTEGKSTRTMVIRHPETGRFHFVTPKQVVPYISQKGGQADRAFREGHQRHNIIYRRDFSNPPKDSEVFEMEQGAQDTLLSHADPAHHELLKKLTDVHIKKVNPE